LLGNGDFEVDRVLALESIGPAAGAATSASEPITLQHILGDITTAIRSLLFSSLLSDFLLLRERIVVRRAMNLLSLPQQVSGVYVHGKLSTDSLIAPNSNYSIEVCLAFLPHSPLIN
jgi:hypothetical protein